MYNEKQFQKDYYIKNKQKIQKNRRVYYAINKNKYKKDKRYYQLNKKRILKSLHKYQNSLKGIYGILRKGAIRRKISFLLTLRVFKKWYNNQEKICIYCHREEKKVLLDYKNSRRLTIDRKDNNKGYTFKNIVLACRLCNRTKSNIFTYKEFKILGKVIRKILINRLDKH